MNQKVPQKNKSQPDLENNIIVSDESVNNLYGKIVELCGEKIDLYMSENFNSVYNANSQIKLMYSILKSHCLKCLSYEILLFNQEFNSDNLLSDQKQKMIVHTVVGFLIAVAAVA